MSIRFIAPALSVLEDQQVTPGEVGWLIEELIVVIIWVVVFTAFWQMTDRVITYEE